MSKSLRTFYTLLITQSISMLGSAMSAFAVAVWVYNSTGEATPLALAATFGALPAIFTTGFAGIATDRFERRRLIMLADAGQAFATFLLLVSIGTDSFQLWHLYMVAAIEAVFMSLQFTAFTSSITMMVPDEQRERANVLQQLTGPVSGIIAPVLAAILLVVIDVEGVLVVDLLTFGIAVTVVNFMHIPQPPRNEDDGDADGQSLLQQVFAGFGILWHLRPLFYLTIFVMLVNYPMRIVMILSTPYLFERTGSEVALGTISGVMSAGMVVGGIIFSIIGGFKSRLATAMTALFCSTMFFALVGMARHEVLLAVFGFLAMAFIPAVDAPFFSILQQKISPVKQGRVFSAVFQMAQALRPLAYVSAGLLADHVFEPAVGGAGWEIVAPLVGEQGGAGMGLLIFISGVGIALSALVVYAIPAIRNLEDTLPNHEPLPEDVSQAEPEEATTGPPISDPALA